MGQSGITKLASTSLLINITFSDLLSSTENDLCVLNCQKFVCLFFIYFRFFYKCIDFFFLVVFQGEVHRGRRRGGGGAAERFAGGTGGKGREERAGDEPVVQQGLSVCSPMMHCDLTFVVPLNIMLNF